MLETINLSAHGACPHCRQNHGFFNEGPRRWFVCTTHKVKWLASSAHFTAHLAESPRVWEKNRQHLAGYERVEPSF